MLFLTLNFCRLIAQNFGSFTEKPAQVPRNVRDTVSMGRRGSAYRAAVARSLGHGIDDAVFEALTESAGPREGERDLRVPTFPQWNFMKTRRERF
jgi:hypothetical protein